LIRSGKVANPITLKTFLPGDIDIAGLTVSKYLARLAAEATTVINAADYGRNIFNLSQVRDFLAIAADLADAHQAGADPEKTFQRVIECVDELRAAGLEHEGTMRTSGAVVTELMNHVAAMYAGRATDNAIKTGLSDLDNRTGGFKPGELIVIAGRPGMGKTTVGGTIALNAPRLGHPTAFFSLEMAAKPIMARLQADLLFDDHPLAVNTILRAKFTEQEFDRMLDAQRKIEALPLVIDDAPTGTVGLISAKVRSVQKRFARNGKRLELVIIDYLKYLRASERYAGQRHYEVGEITAGLKVLAKELKVAAVLLAQLNRQVETRPDRVPQLADLRESGDIEADADVVLLLFREAYYLKMDPEVSTDPEKSRRYNEVANTLEIIIAKQRMGATGAIRAFINLECSAVRNLDRR
jgi:replicative DNA helicase